MRRLVFSTRVREAAPPAREREMPFYRDPLASYDALGRKVPKKLGAIECLRALPWMLQHFNKVVPETYWAYDVDEDDNRIPYIIVVQCQCGHTPAVPFNTFVECEGGDVCGRTFLFDGSKVRVAGSPTPASSTP